MLIAIVPRPTHSRVQQTPKGPTSTRSPSTCHPLYPCTLPQPPIDRSILCIFALPSLPLPTRPPCCPQRHRTVHSILSSGIAALFYFFFFYFFFLLPFTTNSTDDRSFLYRYPANNLRPFRERLVFARSWNLLLGIICLIVQGVNAALNELTFLTNEMFEAMCTLVN